MMTTFAFLADSSSAILLAYTGLAQFGRAPGLGPGGREFDSRIRYCGIEQLDSSRGSYPRCRRFKSVSRNSLSD